MRALIVWSKFDVMVRAVTEDPDRGGEGDYCGGEQAKLDEHVVEQLGVGLLLRRSRSDHQHAPDAGDNAEDQERPRVEGVRPGARGPLVSVFHGLKARK